VSDKTEMFRVTASFCADSLIVEYPSLAGPYISSALGDELEAQLEDSDAVTFTIRRVWMTAEEMAELTDSPEFEGFR